MSEPVNRYDINLKALIKKGLEGHRGHWPEIAARADVSYSMLAHFMQDATLNPRLGNLQSILDTLRDIEQGKIILATPESRRNSF